MAAAAVREREAHSTVVIVTYSPSAIQFPSLKSATALMQVLKVVFGWLMLALIRPDLQLPMLPT